MRMLTMSLAFVLSTIVVVACSPGADRQQADKPLQQAVPERDPVAADEQEQQAAPGQDSVVPEQQGKQIAAQESVETLPQGEQEQSEASADAERKSLLADPEFDISIREHAAARLVLLHGVISEGNPAIGQLASTRAHVAFDRIAEICGDFRIDPLLDVACDYLLQFERVPFSDATPILTSAIVELHNILPRRHLGDVTHAPTWDADIYQFDWPADLESALIEVLPELTSCADAPRSSSYQISGRCSAIAVPTTRLIKAVKRYEPTLASMEVPMLNSIAAAIDVIEALTGIQTGTLDGQPGKAEVLLNNLASLGFTAE